MKVAAVILAVAGAAYAQVASEYSDGMFTMPALLTKHETDMLFTGQPQVGTASSAAAGYSTSAAVSTVVASSAAAVSSAAPYPVPGGNSSVVATGTAPAGSGPATLSTSGASTPSAPAPSGPVATNAAAAIQMGAGAALAGFLAFLA